MRLNTLGIIFLLLVAVFALPAGADVFNMPNGLTSLETVPVGDPGNAPDTRYGSFGAVGYSYNIGKYEVTAGQYCQFLNAVAASDMYGLYNADMDTSADPTGCRIIRSGEPGGYAYTVAADWANRPVNCVSFWEACRFVNWLGNGQPAGPQGPGTTETGAYTLDGYNGSDGRIITRNANATWALPSEDEWYKAAYYKAGGANAGYWNYPTRSDTAPSNVLDPVGANNANYRSSGVLTIGAPYYRTEVGDFAGSPGPYGTFDQGGNVNEWNEAIPLILNDGTVARGSRGGEFLGGMPSASGRGMEFTSLGGPMDGFRVVQVPEPSCATLLVLGVLRRIRRKPNKL